MSSTIDTVLHENRHFPPSAEFAAKARISGMAAYRALCKQAEDDYEGFWAGLARQNLSWKKPFTQVLDESNAPFFSWFADGDGDGYGAGPATSSCDAIPGSVLVYGDCDDVLASV